MSYVSRMIAGTTAMILVLAFCTSIASASAHDETPLACTGQLSNAHPADNAGAGSTQCETTTPQPLSNADMNDHGANNPSNDNPYLANGYGQVQGGHLAGTEGRADNKFPLGQFPNGTDSNRGYECDQNPGIGNGNPAHTTCAAAPQTETEVPGGTQQPGKPSTPPGEVQPETHTQSVTPTHPSETPRSVTPTPPSELPRSLTTTPPSETPPSNEVGETITAPVPVP